MAMKTRGNTLQKVLVVILVIAAAVAVAEHFYLMNLSSRLETAKSDLSSLQQQVTDAQTSNEELQTKESEQTIAYRNAQGRMSFLGNGTGKVCYLTFDDGPYANNTKKNLATLKKKGAVATWFCLANDEEQDYLSLDLCKDIEAAGCAVGVHDWEQDESYSYYKGSVQNYFDTDFDKTKKKLEGIVGHEINICRFAGGSATIGYYNEKNRKALPIAMLKKGIQYFDWNVSAGDADPSQFVGTSTPKDKIVSNVLKDAKYFAKKNSPICVLMHDNPGKETTAEALPEIIDGLKELGYTFDVLTNDTPGFYQQVLVDD